MGVELLTCATARIGESAGVIVEERKKGEATVCKFVSVHDLRRAFDQRWASRVMPVFPRENVDGELLKQIGGTPCSRR